MRFLAGMRVRSDLAVVAVLLATIMLMVIPLPTLVVDMLLAFNIGLSVLLLLTAFYLHTPVQFSTLPSVILIATVFRLSLSIAVTRLVLVQADAGGIIRTFGDFVVAGNVVVGLVIFLIITVVQFIVITKGAERVAEVAARFTLDAMPGKQMAIDADLRSGDIDQAAARGRRRTLERESQLYGAMDGAMKFVKGDAIAGLIIIAVNLLGGLAIGVLQHGMSLGDAAHTHSILTIGDGLVAQIPALFISITAGTVVTRVGGGEDDSLGGEIAAQISKDSRALWLAAGMTAVMGFVPGFPTVVFLLIAAGLALLARAATQRDAAAAEPLPLPAIPAAPSRLRLFLPAALHEAAGPQLAGLLSRHATVLSEELGITIPATEIISPGGPSTPRDGTFRLELDGVPIAEGAVPAGHLLLADDADIADLAGVAARPGAPLPGRPDTLWAPVAERPRLEAAGLGFQSPVEAAAGVVPVVLRRHAGQLIGIQEARQMLSSAEASWGDLVREAQRVCRCSGWPTCSAACSTMGCRCATCAACWKRSSSTRRASRMPPCWPRPFAARCTARSAIPTPTSSG